VIEITLVLGDLDKAAAMSALFAAYTPRMSKCSTPPIGFIRDLAGESMLTLIGGSESARMRQGHGDEMAKHGDDEGAIRNYRRGSQARS